ncbi:PREDICTED: potassium voltage-gated channel subfamily A member 1-like isoform X2 [Branchiostoma belcheri]|uniref:Potassium voltage-gated channel subfamily A member 1-like isoform X2 n=1 Tax=Branchiostoma belcheri TaxID=7741 RepID=A0A6P4ZHT2_BRABE|nr:PREDICTED: potassium voltage-gated channel subfamily A member 1-like isoform X2 [Branchiostoma belcheri]
MLRSAAIGTAGNIGINNVNDLSRLARAVEQGKENYEGKSSRAQRQLSRLRKYSAIGDEDGGVDFDDEESIGLASLLGRVVTEGLRHVHQPDRRIRLNVSGLKFEVKESLLFRYPQTLLGNSEKRAEFYCPDSDDFFFDRHRPSFEAIFRYYQTGKLIRPSSIPVDVFVDEMRFFRLGNDIISSYLESEGYIFPKPIHESDMPPEGHRRTIWRLMDFPESSIFAKIITFMTMRLTRVFRIMKLSRHFKELQTLMKTVRASIGVLSMMVFFMLTMMVLYSSCVFLADIDAPDTFFESIPDAFWWALVTMTTIGYGDVYPRTLAGKLIGSMCVITGLLVIAMPVPIIVENFNNFYKRDKNMHIAEESVMEKLPIDDSIKTFLENLKERCARSWVGRRVGYVGRRIRTLWNKDGEGQLHNHVSSARRRKRRSQSLGSSQLIELDETVVSVISSEL